MINSNPVPASKTFLQAVKDEGGKHITKESGSSYSGDHKSRGPRFFFGWWTVLVTGIVSGLGHGFYAYGISVFFKDIASELGIGRAVTSTAAGVGRLQGGITSPLVGWLSDKYGPKWVVFFGVFVTGTGLILMNYIRTVGAYIVVWGVMVGVGLNIGLTVAVDKAINDWFISKRGLAQGTKFSLIGVGGIILIPIVTALVAAHGWRITCLIWGCLILVCAPVSLLFVRQKRPEYYGFLPDGVRPETDSEIRRQEILERGVHLNLNFQEDEYSLKEAFKTGAYWWISVTYCIQLIVSGALNIHMIPFLTDMGIDRVSASGMMSLMVFCTIPARFLAGILTDRVSKGRLNLLMAAIFFLQAAGIADFLVSRSMASIYIMILCYGICSGASVPLMLITIGSYFGRKAFGSITGTSNAMRAPFALIAPVFAGWIYDRSGDYIMALILFAIASAVATLIMCVVRPPFPFSDVLVKE